MVDLTSIRDARILHGLTDSDLTAGPKRGAALRSGRSGRTLLHRRGRWICLDRGAEGPRRPCRDGRGRAGGGRGVWLVCARRAAALDLLGLLHLGRGGRRVSRGGSGSADGDGGGPRIPALEEPQPLDRSAGAGSPGSVGRRDRAVHVESEVLVGQRREPTLDGGAPPAAEAAQLAAPDRRVRAGLASGPRGAERYARPQSGAARFRASRMAPWLSQLRLYFR
jgi:hypothetical protein